MSLIQGPPGTGKTTTSAAVAYYLAEKYGKLLACCPSNTAANNLALRIEKTGLKVIRLLSRTKEREGDVGSDGEVQHLTLNKQLECVIDGSNSDSKLSILSRRRDKGRGLTPEEDSQLRGMLHGLSGDLLDTAQVIVSTCSNATDTRICKREFNAVLIDEATQAVEPELLIPVTLRCKQLCLIGDHCQLGPVVVSDEAAPLKQSLFDRMVKLGVVPERLCVQYRMHPALSKWPSGAFYDGALQNGVAQSDYDVEIRKTPIPFPRESHPLVFIHSAASEELASSGTSYINRSESDIVRNSVAKLLQCGVHQSNIGVITPYEGQKAMLKNHFSRNPTTPLGSQLAAIEISSVDAFQGREMDYIILSCVRSNEGQGIGFLTDPRRMNVSITRSRLGLIIVGNAMSLGSNHLWHGLLQHINDMGVLCTGSGLGDLVPTALDIPPPRETVVKEETNNGWVSQPAVDGAFDDLSLISQPDFDFTQLSENYSNLTSSAGPPSLLSYGTQSTIRPSGW